MVAEFFGNVWDYIVSFVKQFNFLTDTLDILIVAFVVYSLIKLVRDSRASLPVLPVRVEHAHLVLPAENGV